MAFAKMTYEQKLVPDQYQIPYQIIKIQRLRDRIVAWKTLVPEKLKIKCWSPLVAD